MSINYIVYSWHSDHEMLQPSQGGAAAGPPSMTASRSWSGCRRRWSRRSRLLPVLGGGENLSARRLSVRSSAAGDQFNCRAAVASKVDLACRD